MPRFAIGEMVDNTADDHSCGVVVAVFPMMDGSYRYAIDAEGYGALQFVSEERLNRHTTHFRAAWAS